MAVNQATGYNRTTKEPLDALYLNSGSVYASIAAVNAAVNINVRYTGSRFNVNGEDYWYKNGVQDSDLVVCVDKNSFATTQSFQAFTQSIHTYTQSNDIRVSDTYISQSNYTPSSSFHAYTQSVNIQLSNIYISESNYLPTASFNPISSSFDARVLANSASIYSIVHNSGSLATLTDVVIASLTPGQALVYDTGTSKWKNASFISASVSGNAATATNVAASGVTGPGALTKTDDTNVTLTLGGSPSTALLAATSITVGWTGTLADARITSATNWNLAYAYSLIGHLPLAGGNVSGNILMSGGAGIDAVLTAGTDILNIGTSNADTINIGWSGATVNIQGTVLYNNVTNLQVTDKLITVNKGGAAASGVSAGFEVEEGGVITGYFATDSTRTGWDFKAPASQQLTLGLDLLSAARVIKMPNASGTIALLTSLSSTATGLTYTNTSGVFSLTSGYVIPTTTEQSNWNTAYSWGNWAASSHYIGTTLIANNRASGAQTLTGVSIDGNAATATNVAASGVTSGHALGLVDDTNVTLSQTASGLPTLIGSNTITVGWTGTLADSRIASASNWNTAYSDRMKWDGGATGLVAATGRASLGLVIGVDVLAYRTFGTAANNNTGDFATAAQGTKADTAFSWGNHAGLYSLLGHIHDDRYYTETEIQNFFSGASAITGYNKSNWDTAYGWGNHASAGYITPSYQYYIGTTLNALNRASGAQTLTGISIDGNAATATNVAASGVTGGAALSLTDDINVTITQTGSTSALLAAKGLIIGWTGTLADGRIASAATWHAKQTAYTNLTTIGALANANGFLRQNGAGVFSYDTNTYYLASNPSGYISGNQTITLSGHVTGSGATSITTTIANSVVTNAMLVNSSFFIGTTSISLGRASAGQTLTGISIDGNAATATNVAASGVTGGAALSLTDDTNITITQTGSTTALLAAKGLIMGWTGTLADARITSSGNWNTAYNYSQIGHLPLSGGTVNGRVQVIKSAQTSYSTAALEVYTSDGAASEVGISFHRGGVSAGFLSHGSYGGLRWNGTALVIADGNTYALSITGNANYATTAGSTTLLAALGSYVWSASTAPSAYALGIQNSFVSATEGFASYGSVMTVKTYASGGGTLQLYTPYGDSYGGTALRFRNGNYPTDAWTAWKTIVDDTQLSVTPTVNSIVKRDGNGYVEAVYFKSTNTGTQSSGLVSLTGKQSGDSYMYEFSAPAVRTFIGLTTSGWVDLTSAQTISGAKSFSNTIIASATGGNIKLIGTTDAQLTVSGNTLYLSDWATGTNGLNINLTNGNSVVSGTFTATGDINTAANAYFGNYVFLNSKLALRGTDTYLRLNQNGEFADGVYLLYNLRTDGTTYFGGTNYYINGSNAVVPNLTMLSGGAKLLTYNVGGFEIEALQTNYFGYSYSYAVLQVGDTRANRSIAFGVDLTGNVSGAFSGLGSEYFWKNVGSFRTPNAANNAYNYLFSWDGDGRISNLKVAQLTMYGNVDMNSNAIVNAASISSLEYYTTGYYRSTGAKGLYNSTYDTHLYSSGANQWNFTSSNNSYLQIALLTHGYGSTPRGYLYADYSNNIGFLGYDGNWALRMDNAKNAIISGGVQLTSSGSSFQSTYAGVTSTNLFTSTAGAVLSVDGDWPIILRRGGMSGTNMLVVASTGSTLSTPFSVTGGRTTLIHTQVGAFYTQSTLEVYSDGTWGPRISLHYGGVVASQIGVEVSGRIAILNNPGTGYENLIAANAEFSGDVTLYTAGVNRYVQIGSSTNYYWRLKANGDNFRINMGADALTAVEFTYPTGAASFAHSVQSPYFKATTSYQLLFNSAAEANLMHHDNSNLYVAGNIYVAGNGWNTGNLLATQGWVNGAYQPLENQRLSTSNSVNFSAVTLSGGTAVNANQIYLPTSSAFHVNYSGGGQTHIGNTSGGVYFYGNTDFNSYSIGNVLGVTASNVYAGTVYSNTIRNTAGEAIVSYSSNVNYIGGGAAAHSLAFYAGGVNRAQLSTGGSFVQNTTVVYPNAKWGGASSGTGPVVIKIPGGSANYGMIHMTIAIYEYNSNAASTITVGGHNWSSGWYSTSVNVEGYTNKQVRLGFKDGQYCVVIGDASSTWTYGQVVVMRVQNGEYYSGSIDLGGTWSVALESDTYTAISGDLRTFKTPKGISLMDDVMRLGVDDTYGTTYNAIGFSNGSTSNANNKIFARTDGTAGIFINAASGQNVYLRSGGAEVAYGNASNFHVATTTGSTSWGTGALTVAGGAGINGNLYTSGNIVSGSGVYSGSWFYNSGITGIYNSSYGGYFYNGSASVWSLTSNNGLVLRSGYESTIKGYLYYDGSGFGLLNAAGGWAVRTNGASGQELHGNWAVSGTLDVTGKITGTAGGQDSDIRLKDFHTFNPLSIANSTELRNYTWKDASKGTEHRYGYAAQDIQKILPEAVYEVTREGVTTLAVEYTMVHTVIIDEHTREINELKAKVKQLEDELGR